MMANENEIRDDDERPDFPAIHSYYFKIYQYKKCLTKRTLHPEASNDHRIVCYDRYVYVFSDIYNTASTSKLWQYNIDSHCWLQLQCENFPRGVASSGVILDGKFLLVFGGIKDLYYSDTNEDLYVCDLEPPDDVYTFKLVPTTGKKPRAQYGRCVIKDGEYLYTIGGTHKFLCFMDVHRLNLRTKVWEALFLTTTDTKEESRGRYRHMCALFNNKIYVFGGYVPYELLGFKKLPVFDLVTREWSSELTHGDTSLEAGKQYPSPRVHHSCIQKPENNAQVFIIGGFSYLQHYRLNRETSCWMIDLNTMRWKEMSSLELRYGTYGHFSAVTPFGKLYTHGGIILDNNGYIEINKSMFEAWIQVPSLKEMCWEAALQFVHKLPLDYLKRLPIPADYKKRLLDLPGISDER